jgi:hypothetical protein
MDDVLQVALVGGLESLKKATPVEIPAQPAADSDESRAH